MAGRAPSGDQRLRGLNRDGRVAAVRIGADRLRELLVERRAADEHYVLVAQALLLERVDYDLHVGHRRREERRHPEDIGLVFLERLEIFLDRVVDADIDDLETGA